MTNNTPTDWENLSGNYVFQYSYLDREGKERVEIATVNDHVSFLEAVEIAKKHAAEHGEYRVQWVIPKSFLTEKIAQARREGAEKFYDAFYQRINNYVEANVDYETPSGAELLQMLDETLEAAKEQ